MDQSSAKFCSNCGAPLSSDARFCHVCGAAVVASPTPSTPGRAEASTPTFTPPAYQSPTSETTQASPQSWPTSIPVTTAYASFGERFIALMIDWIILTLMFWVVGFVMAVFVYVVVGNSDMADALAGLVVVTAVFVIHWIYFALQESSAKQATFGKRAMKIIVTDEQGQRLTFGRASGRAFARLLSGMFFSVGYIIAALTARKQALHDLIANTLVLRK